MVVVVVAVALRSNDPAELHDALGACIEESDQVLVMLRTLMDISEAEAGLMRLEGAPTDLRRIAQDAAELYEHVAEQAGIDLAVRPGDPVTGEVDPTRVRQAIANLIDNAIQYTARGGRVLVSASRVGSDIEIAVEDTGRGIPAEALPRIWDRLYRVDSSRSERGLRLGLSLVRAIAAAHGGRMSVESTVGVGSKFKVTLPLSGTRPPGSQHWRQEVRDGDHQHEEAESARRGGRRGERQIVDDEVRVLGGGRQHHPEQHRRDDLAIENPRPQRSRWWGPSVGKLRNAKHRRPAHLPHHRGRRARSLSGPTR